MTRECSADYDKIMAYISEYKISNNLAQPEYKSSLKLMHKSYFSSITWHAELHHNKSDLLKENESFNDDIFFRLVEVVSDMGSSLFNWANGNYKASRVMLRIAIENFIRATSALEDKSQLTEKNVYQLFDTASSQSMFNGDKNPTVRKCYEGLHSDYKLLCKDAHTAATQNMEHLTSLADLPAFHKKKSESAAKIYVRVSNNITAIFCILFNSFFHRMHHRNKENILNGLNREIKPVVTAPKDNNN